MDKQKAWKYNDTADKNISDIDIPENNDRQVIALCERFKEYLKLQETLSGKDKAALIRDFEHNLSIIEKLPAGSVSQDCNDKLAATIKEFQRTNIYN